MPTLFHSTVRSITLALLGVGTLIAMPANAATFELVYNGSFNSSDSLNLEGLPPENFSSLTPFTATALFDDTSPNLAAPVGSFWVRRLFAALSNPDSRRKHLQCSHLQSRSGARNYSSSFRSEHALRSWSLRCWIPAKPGSRWCWVYWRLAVCLAEFQRHASCNNDFHELCGCRLRVWSQ